MSSFNNYSNDLTIVANAGAGNVTVDGNLNITGNITSTGVSNLDVSNAYITVAANNTGTLTAMGLLAQTGSANYAGLRFNTTIHAWEMSPQVTSTGAPVAPYTPLNSTAAYSAGPGLNLSASQFSVKTDGVTTAIIAGNVAVAANAIFQTPNIGIARGTSLSVTGNVSANNYTGTGFVRAASLSTSGNITGAYFTGNGAGLTGITVNYSNANVTGLLASGTVTTNVITTANVTGSYILGNGSQLTGMYGNTEVAAYLPTYTGDLSANNIAAAANITAVEVSTTGNITGDYIIGNGALLTGTYGNTEVAAYLPTYTGDIGAGNITVSANISAAYYTGDGGLLTNVQTSYGNSNVAEYLANYTGNISALDITASGHISGALFSGNGSALYDIEYSNVNNAYSNANVAGYIATYTGNITANTVSTTGNVTASYFQGNVAFATGLPTGYSNALVSAFLSSGTDATDITTTANVTGSYILGNVSQSSGLPTGYSNTLVSAYLASGTANANITTTANVTGAYLLGNVSQATGLPTGYSNALVSAFLSSGTDSTDITTTANVSGAYFLGNISYASGMYNNANVAAFLPAYTGNISANNIATSRGVSVGTTLTANAVAVTGNVSATNLLSTNIVSGASVVGTTVVSSVGNIVGANLVSAGNAVVGNIRTDNYLFANGTPFIPAGSSYGNANVAGFLPTYNGALGATSFELGDANTTVSTESWTTASTITTLATTIFSYPVANVTGIDFNITATNSTGRQVSKIATVVFGSQWSSNEYVKIKTGIANVATYIVTVVGGNMLVNVEAATSALTEYTIVTNIYA